MSNINRFLVIGIIIFSLATMYTAYGWIMERPIEADSSLFTCKLEDMDFSEEVSGRLSIDNSSYIAEEKSVTGDSSQDSYNKLRCWGILRQKNHQPAKADPGAPELIQKYSGIYIGDIKENKIYLTFDEGYENGYTPKILDTLAENNTKAIFFITGPYLNEHQELVRRMVEEGHIVGNHTVGHPSLPTIGNEKIENEVLGLERLFYEKFGQKMTFLRPPKGEYSERSLELTNKLGYINVFWSFAYDDWYTKKQRGWEYAYNKVMENLHNGSIILLHAVSKDNAEALDRIIKDAKKNGYEFGDVRELEQLAKGGTK